MEARGKVDDDGVPLLAFQVRLVAGALEGVDGDDGALEIGEWIAGGRQLLADFLDAGGVEADEWQREAAPQLMLHLLEYVSGGDDEDAFAATAPDEFGQDHADL